MKKKSIIIAAITTVIILAMFALLDPTRNSMIKICAVSLVGYATSMFFHENK